MKRGKQIVMPFKVGDRVAHPEHGLGQIVRLAQQQFPGSPAQLYYEVVTAKSTLWISQETAATCLRPVITGDELPHYRSVLLSPPGMLDPDRRQRQLEVAQRLKEGSFRALCEVVRDLTAQSWRKALNEGDSLSLRKARESLCQEWAAAAAISVSEASREIEALCAEGRQRYQR
jgi:RNA polymerase-interacting CarD/CdnL/TRCF family regulator